MEQLPLKASAQQETYPMTWAGGFRFDPARYYHPGHTWVVVEDGPILRVGLDDLAVRLLGPLEGADLPPEGVPIVQGSPGLSLCTAEAKVPILSPLSGEVLEVNPEAAANPETITGDPYGRGWLFRMTSPRFREGLGKLLTGPPVGQWMEALAARLRIRATGNVVLTFQDGGDMVDDLSGLMVEDLWRAVVGEFLLTNLQDR